jgi:hypothetical protein
MRHLSSLLTFCCIAMATDIAVASPIFSWRGADGSMHFSNREEAIPAGASEVTLPPIPVRAVSRPVRLPAAVVRAATLVPSVPRPARRAAECAVPDATGVAEAVAARLGRRQLDGLTVIVAGVPIAYSDSARIDVKGPDVDSGAGAPAEQAALAYPAGSGCPDSRPPLERYAVASGPRERSRTLCDDYRRAFAEVGVAVSRDQGVARSFRSVAEQFAKVAGRDYTAGGRPMLVPAVATEGTSGPTASTTMVSAHEERVPLPSWAVEAHVAQADQLGVESTAFVDELTAALEEIDAAARSVGCW